MATSERICATCGTTGKPKVVTPGSFLIELVLWIAFLVPGLIYTIWRRTNRRRVCRSCGAAALVPLDSPAGRELLARFNAR